MVYSLWSILGIEGMQNVGEGGGGGGGGGQLLQWQYISMLQRLKTIMIHRRGDSLVFVFQVFHPKSHAIMY